jgi:hypothetical protein
MAEHGMFATTELVPLLADRGIELSASQVHRLVAGTPERLSLPILAALCDIFQVDAGALIITSAENMAPRRAVAGDAPAQVNPNAVRPRRARLRPEQ